MTEKYKVLIAEDDKTMAKYFAKIIEASGYIVDIVNDGREAYERLKTTKYDALLTDWMMPKIDGINLIKIVRQEFKPAPLILMITGLLSEMSKKLALNSGADDFLIKPINPEILLSILNSAFKRKTQNLSFDTRSYKITESKKLPPFIAVVIATSTGGPSTITDFFKNMKFTDRAVFYIVQHGPEWMFDSYSKRIQENSQFKTLICQENMPSEPGKIYIAPGDTHILIDPETYNIHLSKSPKENFVRPSADPLFKSAALAFGRFCIAIVLTGLGADGARGCVAVQSAQGKVFIQDPATAIAPSMPNSVIKTNIVHCAHSIEYLPEVISSNIYAMHSNLSKIKSENQNRNTNRIII